MILRPYLIDFSRLIVADFLRSDVVNKTLAELLALKELQRWQTASQQLSPERRLAADPDLVAAIAASAEQVPITHDDADDHLAAAIAASAEPLPIIHDDGSVHWQGTEDDGGRGAAVGSADLVVAEPALDEEEEEEQEQEEEQKEQEQEHEEEDDDDDEDEDDDDDGEDGEDKKEEENKLDEPEPEHLVGLSKAQPVADGAQQWVHQPLPRDGASMRDCLETAGDCLETEPAPAQAPAQAPSSGGLVVKLQPSAGTGGFGRRMRLVEGSGYDDLCAELFGGCADTCFSAVLPPFHVSPLFSSLLLSKSLGSGRCPQIESVACLSKRRAAPGGQRLQWRDEDGDWIGALPRNPASSYQPGCIV